MNNDNTSTAPALSWTDRLKLAVKRPQFWGFFVSVAVMALISLMFFYPDASQGNELRQHDMLQGAAIGHEAQAYAQATGEATRWTNSLFGGMPTFQISPSYPSNSLFDWITSLYGLGLPSPSNLLFMMMLGFFILMLAMKVRWSLGLIGAIAYGLSTYFVIIIGAGHIWKFVTLAYIPPTIAGIILCYRGRYLLGGALAALFAMMQIASNHVQMTYYFLFVILGLVAALLWRACRRKAVGRWIKATLTLAVAAVLAVVANLPSLYNTYEYSKETMRGGHSELTQADGRVGDSTGGLDREYITQYSYGRSELFTLLIPNVKGGASAKPVKGALQQLSLADLPQAAEAVNTGRVDQITAQYLQYSSQYFGEPEGTNGPVYVGAAVFALFLLGCVIVKGAVKWSLLGLTLLSMLLALGRNFMGLTDLFIDYVPMYSKFRTVESILVIAEFTIPVLAMLALQKLFTDPGRGRSHFKALAWSFGLPAVVCLLGIFTPSVFGNVITDNDLYVSQMIGEQLTAQGYPADAVSMFSIQNPQIAAAVQSLRYGMISSDALRSLMFIAATAAALALYMFTSVRRWVPVTIVGALAVADLYTVNKRYLDHDSFCTPEMSVTDPFAMTAADRAIKQDTAMNYRVMNIPEFWMPNPSYHHKMIGGYHAAKLTRYQDLIDRHIGKFLNGGAGEADLRVLNMLNARYVVTPGGEVVDNPAALGNAWFVDSIGYVNGPDAEMAALDVIEPALAAVADTKFRPALGQAVAKQPGDTIFETTYAPNRLTYHATTSRDNIAVFSEVYFPWGWKAEIDGKEAQIGRVNYVLRAVRIPAGSHTLTMTFDPRSIHTTSTAATVAIIIIYLLLAAAIAAALVKLPATPPANGRD
jgi:hypothetical protein